MGYFDDFDEMLKEQEQNKSRASEKRSRAVLSSRRNWDERLKSLIRLFKDYNETILQPREPCFVILKKAERLDPLPKFSDPIFTYVINVVPKALLPHAFNPFYAETGYVIPNKITKDDWYVKVALQCEIILSEKNNPGELELSSTLRVWGNVEQDEKSLLPPHLQIQRQEAWHLPYTELSLSSSHEREQVEAVLKQALMVMTPKVFTHLQEVFGLES